MNEKNRSLMSHKNTHFGFKCNKEGGISYGLDAKSKMSRVELSTV